MWCIGGGWVVQEALQDPECLGILAATLEETMYNLIEVSSRREMGGGHRAGPVHLSALRQCLLSKGCCRARGIDETNQTPVPPAAFVRAGDSGGGFQPEQGSQAIRRCDGRLKAGSGSSPPPTPYPFLAGHIWYRSPFPSWMSKGVTYNHEKILCLCSYGQLICPTCTRIHIFADNYSIPPIT